jgi:hypothetical protein
MSSGFPGSVRCEENFEMVKMNRFDINFSFGRFSTIISYYRLLKSAMKRSSRVFEVFSFFSHTYSLLYSISKSLLFVVLFLSKTYFYGQFTETRKIITFLLPPVLHSEPGSWFLPSSLRLLCSSLSMSQDLLRL